MQAVFYWVLVMQGEEKMAAILITIFLFHGTFWVIKIHLILMALAEVARSFARGIILVCFRAGIGVVSGELRVVHSHNESIVNKSINNCELTPMTIAR